MNKINPIFEALSNVDERHVPVTKTKRPAKKLMIVLAAAAIMLLTGFTTAAVLGSHVFSFSTGGSAEKAFDLNLRSREFTIPEEFSPAPGENYFKGSTEIPPSELFERFGITPLINDNFTEIPGEKTMVEVDAYGAPEPWFHYTLYNKALERNVTFDVEYFSETEKLTYHSRVGLFPGEPNEIITLNDGSACMVSGWIAVFSYDGAKWELRLPFDFEVPDNYSQMSEDEQRVVIKQMIEAMPGMDAVKQVLADLDLL